MGDPCLLEGFAKFDETRAGIEGRYVGLSVDDHILVADYLQAPSHQTQCNSPAAVGFRNDNPSDAHGHSSVIIVCNVADNYPRIANKLAISSCENVLGARVTVEVVEFLFGARLFKEKYVGAQFRKLEDIVGGAVAEMLDFPAHIHQKSLFSESETPTRAEEET